MMYEYKVLPAPTKGLKAKGIKSNEARFAHALQVAMNEQATDGWEFQRAETLPAEERSGLRSSQKIYRNMLVFRRAVIAEPEQPQPPAALIEDHSTAVPDGTAPVDAPNDPPLSADGAEPGDPPELSRQDPPISTPDSQDQTRI